MLGQRYVVDDTGLEAEGGEPRIGLAQQLGAMMRIVN